MCAVWYSFRLTSAVRLRRWCAMAKRATSSIPLAGSRPSITRSDALSGALHDAGLGVARMVIELNAMLAASVSHTVTEPDPIGKGRIESTVQLPNWSVRMRALEMLHDIHGYLFSPQKAQDQHPIVVILNQLPDETRQAVEQSIENRLKGLLKPGIN
jgi:hypothetical protein